jgi:hypothetical protein
MVSRPPPHGSLICQRDPVEQECLHTRVPCCKGVENARRRVLPGLGAGARSLVRCSAKANQHNQCRLCSDGPLQKQKLKDEKKRRQPLKGLPAYSRHVLGEARNSTCAVRPQANTSKLDCACIRRSARCGAHAVVMHATPEQPCRPPGHAEDNAACREALEH